MKIKINLKWLTILTETTKNQKTIVGAILLFFGYIAFLSSDVQPKDGVVFAAFSNALILLLLGYRRRKKM